MNKYIFIHIPKTAGSSFRNIIKREYSPAKMLSCAIPKELDYSTQKKWEILTGHFPFGIHEKFNLDNFAYLTILREPISRVISFYNYSRINKNHYLHELTTKYSIKELLENNDFSDSLIEFNNLQIRLLTGVDAPFGACKRDMLDFAINNIEKHFLFVGIQELFNESMNYLKYLTNWKDLRYTVKNKTRRKSITKEKLDRSTLDLIIKYNQLDIELYNYSKKILLENVEKYLENKIEIFESNKKELINLNIIKYKFLSLLKTLKIV